MAQSHIKYNPFQKSNPFQIPTTYQNYNTNYQNNNNYQNYNTNALHNNYQSKITYKSFGPTHQTFQTKENTYLKNSKFGNEMWKFRDNNCDKTKGFNCNSILNDRSLQQKNSFQKELVLNSTVRRYQNASSPQKQFNNQKIENPFNRKYLVTQGKLAQSYVYVPGSNNHQMANYDSQITSHRRLKTDNESLKYNNYMPSQNQTLQQGVAYSLQNSLTRGIYQQYSRKSIQHHQSPLKNENYYNNPIQSRYSLDRQKNQNKNGSYQNLYLPSNQNISNGNSRTSKRSRASKKSIDSFKDKQNQKVIFDQSDSDREESLNKNKKINNSVKQMGDQQLKGPQTIILKGLKFYRQKLQKI